MSKKVQLIIADTPVLILDFRLGISDWWYRCALSIYKIDRIS
ncbi:hypothetical protein D1AOALGA4SA_9200 [Olavius algarvensis Delta 1 endosymbiont]|nr:hypothetical protein D1AOALGA4SA_9200 [Olavius algarvensis Delta 1 endosymbiont]